jgi:hypothetical protein
MYSNVVIRLKYILFFSDIVIASVDFSAASSDPRRRINYVKAPKGGMTAPPASDALLHRSPAISER